MAMPTAAAASAGASLMPSPTLATPPGAGELADDSELVLRQQFGVDLHAECLADGFGIGAIVAGQHHGRDAQRSYIP